MKSKLLYLHRRLDYFIALWVIFLVLHISLTGKIFIWEMFSFLPGFIFVIIPVLLGIKCYFRSEYRLNYFIIILLTLPFVLTQADINFMGIINKTPSEQVDVIVFNWNTEFWEDDKEKFYEFLKEQNADIYHLQEFLDLNAKENEKFVRASEDLDGLKEAFPDYKLYQNHELITLTKLPVEEVYADFDNAFLRIDIQVNNKIISFYNVHIPVHINTRLSIFSKTYFEDLKLRFDRRTEQLKLLEEDIANNPNEKFISGDFNTMISMGKMKDLLIIMHDSTEVSNTLFPATWETGGLKLWRIDYNLATEDIKFLEHKNVDPKDMSDHWGQKVKLKIKE